MTIPTRPAPAPPVSQIQNSATGANSNIEQLRRKLELQHRQKQQQSDISMQNLTIKLPPPPKVPANGLQTRHANSNDYDVNDNNKTSSITRKFPKARYAPTTNWEDSPFELSSEVTKNGHFKKIPPPRPPPPKVNLNGYQNKVSSSSSVTHSSNMISNLFQRKKNSKNTNATNRTYVGTINNSSSNSNNHFTQLNAANNSNSQNWNTNWSSELNYVSSSFTSVQQQQHQQQHSIQEAQLISFDSPPSSPTFTQKSNSDCVSVDSFSSDSNFSSPHNGSVSQPESGFEDDFANRVRSRPTTTSPLDPWETVDAFTSDGINYGSNGGGNTIVIGTAPVRNLNALNTRLLTNNDNPLCNGKSLLPPAPSLTAPTIIKPKISQKPKAPKPPPLLPKSQYEVIHRNDLPFLPSPPMPQCAPPPLPSTIPAVNMLDVISGNVDAIHLVSDNYTQNEIIEPFGVALYDFEGVELNDLSFRENDKIYLLEQVSVEWYRGRTRTGCEGIFPANYIDVKVPLAPNRANEVGRSADYKPCKIRCLYNFIAEVEGDLLLKENDFVCVLYRINEDWLYGECNGKKGQFPANFLERIPSNVPLF